MIIRNKQFVFFGGLSAALVLAGILGFSFFSIKESQAIDMGDEGPACFYDADCDAPLNYCTYGYGFASCGVPNDCANCGDSIEGAEPGCVDGFCVVILQGGDQAPCGMCIDEQDPPPPPQYCDVDANNFNNALYIKSPDGTTQFAITNGGHLLTLNGNGNISPEPEGDSINISFGVYSDNNFPIYNDDDLLAAFFHSDDAGIDDYFYLRGSINEFEVNLTPPPGSFVIKNSADMVVAYIDPVGDLYLMGCVDDDGYEF